MHGEAFDSTDGVWPAFSDLLAATTLLFIVLFAVITIPSIQQGNELKDTQLRLDSLSARLAARANGRYATERLVDHLRITIGEEGVWDQGQWSLKSMDKEGRRTLRELAEVLGAPEVLQEIDQIHVVGHTSSEGPDDANWELSSRRATTIALYLMSDGRLPPCVLTALGRGRYYPTDPQKARSDTTGNPRDRRIEIEIRSKAIVGDSSKVSKRECVDSIGVRAVR